MQSRLGSVRVLLGAFNDFSSFSSSSWSSSSSLRPFDRSRCIPRDIATVVPFCARLVSSLLFIAAGSQANRTNGSMARRKGPSASISPARPDIWHVRIQIRLRDHSRYVAADDYLATLIELKITGRIPRSPLDCRDCALFTGPQLNQTVPENILPIFSHKENN